MKRVAGLGQCSLDYIASVDGFPLEDAKKEAVGFTVQGGGPVATALVSLSRLGVKTAFIGRVSNDGAGKEIRRGLEEEGVDIRGLKTKKGGSSQIAVIIVNGKTGSRTILWKRPTVGALSAKEVDPDIIKRAGVLLLDGLMTEASLKAARLAKENGVRIMLDAGRVREGMLELAGLSDYIVASEEFARGVAASSRAALERLAAFKPLAATITLGPKGSITWHDGRTFSQPAFRIKAVDTTGAGDVFHGGYIYGLLKGWGIEKTVRFASAFAALKCLEPGGRAGIPSEKKTLAFMKSY